MTTESEFRMSMASGKSFTTIAPQQLALMLRPARERGSIVAPFPLSQKKALGESRRLLRRSNVSANEMLATAKLLADQALLGQVRRGARHAARAGGRMSKRALVTYIGKPEGQRVSRVIARLSERIAIQEARLCG